MPAAALRGRRVHALAGIGEPQRFFATLQDLGLAPVCHAFADHHRFVPADLDLGPCDGLLMTEKDAVKCAGFAPDHAWYLPVEAVLQPDLAHHVTERLLEKRHGSASA
jgi:tetraacyldisaccharide 4'-kinase